MKAGNLFYKNFKIIILIIFSVILVSCSYGISSPSKMSEQLRAAWIVYWDLDAGEKELLAISRRGKLDQLLYFAAYFDENDRLFIPPELSERKIKLQAHKKRYGYETYLSFVNDTQNADGSSTLKDIEILRRLFSDDSSMERHIDEIIAMTLAHGYDGVDLDYEQIWIEEDVGQLFLRFIEKLYPKTIQNNLKLRVVLEPSTPFSADFVSGPEYSVMFYDLYGSHSGPGPKANNEFIRDTIQRMLSLPGEKTVAFATGGCMWGSDGSIVFIDEVEARNLAKKHRAKATRDKNSECLVFSFQDKGVSYTVWYADIRTLNYWVRVAAEQGQNNINIWRLGGNVNLHRLN